MSLVRCNWVDLTDELMVKYHDEEYGVKRSGLKPYFEKICLESFQSGLSWRCILHKREEFRRCFYDFDPYKVAKMTEVDVMVLLGNKGIVRHRKKIEATINNAKRVLEIEKDIGYEKYINTFKDGETLAKELKKKGFSFVGETTCSEYLTSIGNLPSHEQFCFRYEATKV